MRFVKGRTLSEAARDYHAKRLAGQADALGLPALLNAFVMVCNTVAYAALAWVLHRDLKGQNVILGDFGEVVVLDWGLAKLVGRPDGGRPGPRSFSTRPAPTTATRCMARRWAHRRTWRRSSLPAGST